MALFEGRNIKGIMADRGLDQLSDETATQAEAILSELDAKKLLKDGDTANFTDRSNQEKIGFLRALVEQNWIIISQNERLLQAAQQRDAQSDES